ncbi:hypothetical protein UFOVP785_70 [uncultured Caudovirales phage]|uniref:Uncharacterized protein n=1 Tax=uncultured Caudovirales phage TaxID=2100421 RepID=A0A6J5NY43_9CAUD|nr:hypothetical protein UFOVP785_70 [uncultured Caudovirales phage]
MVELTHNGKRYMVDGGQWFRRLEVGERLPQGYEYRMGCNWITGHFADLVCNVGAGNLNRVPCTDPRPPFTVGQRVKVARKDESWPKWEDVHNGFIRQTHKIADISADGVYLLCGWLSQTFPPWCLDAVEVQHEDTLADMAMIDLEKRFTVDDVWESQPQLNGEPCLQWILSKLAKQPEKTGKKLEIIQRAMSELVKLEGE